jgi:L-lysine exporter family protein LysE/ArgO
MMSFFSYILLGLTLSAPMGPINAAQLDKGIRYGFLHSWLIGFGAMLADALYMIIIYFGIAPFVDNSLIKTFLWSFGFFVLCYTGIETIIHSKTVHQAGENHFRESKRKALRTGFFIALFNPLNILFWLGIYGSILVQVSATNGSLQLLIYSAGIFLGITIWDVTMAGFSAGARSVMNPKILQAISILSGTVVIGFGIYFGMQAAKLLFG